MTAATGPVRVRLFAGAAEAVGTDAVTSGAATVGDLVEELVAASGEATTRDVLALCSFLVAGRRTDDPGHALPRGGVVDVLPPFAGG